MIRNHRCWIHNTVIVTAALPEEQGKAQLRLRTDSWGDSQKILKIQVVTLERNP